MNRRAAFSLVEVVLSLGIVSFAFVGLLGLLPIGLNTFNNSIDATVESQIAQGVLAEVKQAKFSQLSTLNAGSASVMTPTPGFYFDDQGKPVTSNPTSSVPSGYIYCAGVQVYYNSTLPAGVQPSSTTTTYDKANIATVVVTVNKISTPGAARVFTSFVANNGL